MKTKRQPLILLIGLCVLSVSAFLLSRAETVPQTQTTLKSYFQTGLRPTQTNYWEFIDTMFWYANQSYSNAQYAAQSAASFQQLYQGYLGFTISVSTIITGTGFNNYNVAFLSITNDGTISLSSVNNNGDSGLYSPTQFKCNVVFSNALPGTTYGITFSSPAIGTTFTAGNKTTVVRLDGFHCTQVTGNTLTTTNCIFYLDSAAAANLNGLSVTVIAQ